MQYPGGFADPEMEKIGKRHNVDKMTLMAKESFNQQACSNVHLAAENMVKIINRSSMISMFEKPKFRDFVKGLDENGKAFMVNALSQLLHNRAQAKQRAGFEALVDILRTEKLAKWSLVTIIPAYYAPQREIFVKPTTTKNVLRYFEITDPVYKPSPTWEFYQKYRKLINQAKTNIDPNLSPTNAAFTGFLMMTVKS
ncbi:MAG: hypothetical protein KUG75_08465 [Pseudomonadales bacterium]|nr:hypothetical protein [Pseudomonadales bacterium]